MSQDRGDVGRLLRWYPAAWRQRYGDEFVALLEDTAGEKRHPIGIHLSVVWAGMRERARAAGLVGDQTSQRERGRISALVVLVGWALFVVAGSAFAKLSEHAGPAVSASTRRTVNGTYRIVEVLAIVATIAVVLGAVACVQPFVAFVRNGQWHSVRRHTIVAGTATALAAAGTIGLVMWARGVSPAVRQSGAWPYGLGFLAWALSIAAAIAAWTATAVAVARRIDISDRVLRTELVLSRTVVLAMLVMTVATAVWWAAVAASASPFLDGSGPITLVLATMVVADVIAAAGALRGARGTGAPV